MRIAFRIRYLGTAFFGSQIQPGLRTVEGEFIEACRRLSLFDDWKTAALTFAGRTDRGVHARGQVCAFSTDHPDRATALLNVQLPRDCQVSGYCEVPEGFHPRYDAVSRTYRYFWPQEFPAVAEMDREARRFLGEHDFSSFARIEQGHDPVRRVFSARVFPEDGYTVFEITAASFLWNMVRCMATVLESAGSAPGEEDRVEGLLEKHCPRPPAAPAEGLVLWHVEYGIEFQPVEPSPRSMVYFDEVWHHHRRMERICREVGGDS
jgi:tRNA pseudouridine38-40 synthase